MEENLPECISQSAFTELKIIESNFTWTISNVSYYVQNKTEEITSPEFAEKEKGDFKWLITFRPGFVENTVNSEVKLHLVNNSDVSIQAKLKFSLLDQNQKIIHTSGWSIVREFSNSVKTWGYSHFIVREILFSDANYYMPNDSLTILCQIKMYSDAKSTINRMELSINDGKAKVMEDLNSIMQTGFLSDVTLVIQGTKVKAHKVILSMRSSVFYEMISKLDEKSFNINEIMINEFSYKIMFEVLRYIYTGKVENIALHAVPLLIAADTFNLSELKVMCEDSLINKMNITNSISLLTTAIHHEARKLKTKAIEFVILHSKSLMDTPEYEELKETNPEIFSEIFGAMISMKSSDSKQNLLLQ